MNARQISFALVGALASSLALGAAQPAVPAAVSAAVADASRPATDTQRDGDRKPADVVAFSGLKAGDQVVELQPGRGYYTKILCKVVGDKGHVTTINIAPPPRPDAPAGQGGNRAGAGGGGAGGGAGGGGMAAAAAPQAGTPCANVTASRMTLAELKLPGALDLVWTSENYHDYHNMMEAADMKALNKAIFDALKPGGVYLVEDHAAAAGSGARDTRTLHRIDPAVAIADITGVGFVLDGQSKVLAHPEDDHTANSGSLEGKTDRFLLKFRKPAR